MVWVTFHKSWMEDGIDLNQYFPYYFTDQTLCMQTIAERTINKINRDHVFQLRFTFHGGMEAIIRVFLLLYYVITYPQRNFV